MDKLVYRSKILNSALELVREEGIRKLTVANIVKRCGLSYRIFYQCYTAKEELLKEIQDMYALEGIELPSEKQLILEKAEEGIARYGFGNITLDSIASAAGLNRSTVYKYFSDKYELLESCFEDQYVKTKVIIKTLYQNAAGNPEHFMWSYIENYSYFLNYSKDTSLYTEAWSHLKSRVRIRELTYELHDFVRQVLSTSIKEGVEKGIYKQDLDVEYMTEFLMITLSGMSVYMGNQQEGEQLSRKMIETILKVIMGQLKAAPVEPAPSCS